VGVLYEPMNAKSAADAIEKIFLMCEGERELIRKNARTLSLRFDRDKIATSIEHTIKALVNGDPLPDICW